MTALCRAIPVRQLVVRRRRGYDRPSVTANCREWLCREWLAKTIAFLRMGMVALDDFNTSPASVAGT
jgi:hypothetical protein